MIALSTTEAERFTPPWLTGDDAPVFLLRAGSVIDRAMLEAELTGKHRAGRVFTFELRDTFKAGIMAVMADDPAHDQLIEWAAAEAEGGDLADAERQALHGVRDSMAEFYSDYADLLGRMARRREIAPILTLQRFLVGWENVSLTFARGADGRVPLDLIGKLDSLQMLAAGNRAYELLYPDAEELEGNSPRPSPSDDNPKPSTTASGSKAAGASRAASGKKTRVSRSTRASGA